MRLERRGDTVTMFVAQRGESLHQVGASIKLHLDGPFYAGLGVCAHSPKAMEKAVFSHVELKVLEPVASTELRRRLSYTALCRPLRRMRMRRRATVRYTARERFEAPNWTRDGKSLVLDAGR